MSSRNLERYRRRGRRSSESSHPEYGGRAGSHHEKLAKDLAGNPAGQVSQGAYANAPKQQQGWLQDSGQEFNTFTRSFVSSHQPVWHLHGQPKGAEQFGAAGKKVAASPTEGAPGEQTGNNTTT